MVVKHLTGRLTEDGELKLDRPEELHDLAPGDIEITVKGDSKAATEPNEDVTWTKEELKEVLTFHPVPANQMVIPPWDGEPATEDSLADVLERRRKKREANQWQND